MTLKSGSLTPPLFRLILFSMIPLLFLPSIGMAQVG